MTLIKFDDWLKKWGRQDHKQLCAMLYNAHIKEIRHQQQLRILLDCVQAELRKKMNAVEANDCVLKMLKTAASDDIAPATNPVDDLA